MLFYHFILNLVLNRFISLDIIYLIKMFMILMCFFFHFLVFQCDFYLILVQFIYNMLFFLKAVMTGYSNYKISSIAV